MAKLLYATTHNKKDCPWLIDSEQLLTLDDSLDAHFAKSLTAGATTDGQAGSILANNLQKRIVFSFRHGKQLETDSFREAISHPEVAHEVITGLKYEASIGRTLAVLTLQKANNKGSLPLTDDEVELSIIVEPHGEPLSEQVLTIMRSWSDNIAAPLWHKFLFELRAFWRFILIAWRGWLRLVSGASIALGAALFGSGFFIDRKHKRLEGKVADDSENNTQCRKARSWQTNQKLWFCLRHRNSPLRPGA